MILNYDVLQETSILNENFEAKVIASKIKSLNNLIQNLMQKKIRIDLEMKRTKVKISNLKKMTMTSAKASLKLEDHQFPIPSRDEAIQICEQNGIDFEDFLEINEILKRAEELEREFEELYAPFLMNA